MSTHGSAGCSLAVDTLSHAPVIKGTVPENKVAQHGLHQMLNVASQRTQRSLLKEHVEISHVARRIMFL